MGVRHDQDDIAAAAGRNSGVRDFALLSGAFGGIDLILSNSELSRSISALIRSTSTDAVGFDSATTRGSTGGPK